jgi:hypothetical protein
MPDIELWPRHAQAERLNIANSNRMVGPYPSRHHHRSYSGGDGARRAACGYAFARGVFEDRFGSLRNAQA